MQGRWMIQQLEAAASREEAEQIAAFLRGQDGCRGARAIGGSVEVGGVVYGKAHQAQAFFDDESEGGLLPDGCRRVWVPESILRACDQAAGKLPAGAVCRNVS